MLREGPVQGESLHLVTQLQDLLHLRLGLAVRAQVGHDEGVPDAVGRDEEVAGVGDEFLEQPQTERQDVAKVGEVWGNHVIELRNALGTHPHRQAEQRRHEQQLHDSATEGRDYYYFYSFFNFH